MATLCPNCREEIDSRDFNVATDVAYCRRCQIATPLSVIRRDFQRAAPEVNLDAQPEGAWMYDEGDTLVIGASTRSRQAITLIPFTALWAGGSMWGIYGRQFSSGHFSLTTSLVGIPFLLGSALLLAQCLMWTVGRVELRLTGAEAVVFTGVGTVGSRKRFDGAGVTRVYEDFTAAGSTSPDGPPRAIFVEGVAQVNFGSLLSDERRRFMASALRKTLGVQDSPHSAQRPRPGA